MKTTLILLITEWKCSCENKRQLSSSFISSEDCSRIGLQLGVCGRAVYLQLRL